MQPRAPSQLWRPWWREGRVGEGARTTTATTQHQARHEQQPRSSSSRSRRTTSERRHAKPNAGRRGSLKGSIKAATAFLTSLRLLYFTRYIGCFYSNIIIYPLVDTPISSSISWLILQYHHLSLGCYSNIIIYLLIDTLISSSIS